MGSSHTPNPSSPAPSSRKPPTYDTWACALVGLGILWLLTYPFDFSAAVQTPWLAETHVRKLNAMSNVVLFVPLGLVIGVREWRRRRPRALALGVAVAIGALLSLLGETVQVYLPGRISSALDLANNAAGSLVGALGGWRAAPGVSERLDRLAAWLQPRPLARRALGAALLLLVARTAPFDISPETRELGEGWSRAQAAAATQWQALQELAQGRWGSLSWSVLADTALFAVAAMLLGRAMRESLERTGDRTNPALFVVILGVLAATLTEVLQWPIRSRVMDPADWLACIVGVLIGAMIDQGMGRLGRRRA